MAANERAVWDAAYYSWSGRPSQAVVDVLQSMSAPTTFLPPPPLSATELRDATEDTREASTLLQRIRSSMWAGVDGALSDAAPTGPLLCDRRETALQKILAFEKVCRAGRALGNWFGFEPTPLLVETEMRLLAEVLQSGRVPVHVLRHLRALEAALIAIDDLHTVVA